MSGFLGQILGNLTGGGAAGGGAAGLSSVLTQLLGGGQAQPGQPQGQPGQPIGQTGGIAGLVAMLDQAGLGDKVRSWIGTGENQPVSPDQLAQALPAEKVQDWSQQTGMAPNTLLSALSQALPQAVDQATPQGAIPEGGAPPPSFDVAGLVGRLLGGDKRTG